MKTKACFITGIGTDVGKTICSAILCEAHKADYWKPVQCGMAPTDTEWVAKHTEGVRTHPETFCFEDAVSPHYAAVIANRSVRLRDFHLPATLHPIVVEGAGGVFVPLNDQEFMSDLMIHLNLPVVIVARFYIGAINHTIMTIQSLKNLGVSIKGVITNGDWRSNDKHIISNACRTELIGHIPRATCPDLKFIKAVAKESWVYDILA